MAELKTEAPVADTALPNRLFASPPPACLAEAFGCFNVAHASEDPGLAACRITRPLSAAA